jgi:VWFA-related protein
MSKPAAASTTEVIVPPVGSRSLNTGRVVTFVVDDGNCRASQVGVGASREAVEKFVNEQMMPTDLVAIYQTRSGSSVFQQYTSDKAQLLRAAKRIRYLPPQLGCAMNDGSFYDAAKVNTFDKLDAELNTVTKTIESDAERKIREGGEDLNNSEQVTGTIGVLRYIIRGLERVSGRKVVFLMSDGLPFRGRDGKSTGALSVLRDLTDQANRSSVVFNTIDSRGLFDASMIEARDRVSTRDDAVASEGPVADRRVTVRDSRDGLSFLANETGGNFYHDQNSLDVPVRTALALEKGYYLLAYEPDEETFKGKNFNKIEIKLARPELKVSSRAGFIGTVNEPTRKKQRSADSDLYEALVAPLPSAGLNLRLTAFFGNDPASGNFVRSLIHLNESGGMIKAVFDVVAVTMNEKNEVVDEFTRNHTFKIPAAAMPLIQQNGLIYTTDVPIKKAGSYTFRVAVRDATTRMLGSASQAVQIPDLKKGRLAMSALTVTQVGQDGKFSVPAAVKPENALSLSTTNSVPAIRKFRRGMILAYAFTVYNARRDNAAGKPSLSVQMNLYRDGKLVMEGKPLTTDLEKQADWSRLNDYAYFRLLPDASAGDYALQIIVKDLLAKGNEVTSQWVDFEVEG